MVRSVFSIIINLTSLNVFLFCRKGCFSSRWLHNLFSSLAATEVGRLERYLLIYFGFKYGRNAPGPSKCLYRVFLLTGAPQNSQFLWQALGLNWWNSFWLCQRLLATFLPPIGARRGQVEKLFFQRNPQRCWIQESCWSLQGTHPVFTLCSWKWPTLAVILTS